MAVYEYLCPNCGKEFELMRPMSQAGRPAKCPKCGSKARKLISSFGSKTGDSIQPSGKPFRRKGASTAGSARGRAGSKGKRQSRR